MNNPTTDAPQIVAFPPLLLLAALTIGIGLHFVVPLPLTPKIPLRVIGGSASIAALLIVIRARSEMAKAGTNVNPRLPSTAIVVKGPYRLTRNPMYLSHCLLNFGVGLLLCDAVAVALTAVLAAVLNWGVIVREEHYLDAKFGSIYREYRGRVRRWI